jgi:hypothetical protein
MRSVTHRSHRVSYQIQNRTEMGTKQRRAAVAATAPRRKQAAKTDADASAVARPNAHVRDKRRVAPTDSSSSPSVWQALVESWLPTLIITGVAYAAVAYGFTTAPEYIRSKSLMLVFRRAFIALVCLTNRSQLHHIYHPPTKPTTLKLLAYAQCKSLAVVILANCAGTTVIQPLFNQPPAYAKTIELVVPIYVLVEIAVGLLKVPPVMIQLIGGFLVSWLKAATTSTLVLKWQEDDGAHPVAFVLICTCNLFASGLVLRYVSHFHASRRILSISLPLVWSLVQMLAIGGFVGLLAFVANLFSTQAERQLEATMLYFAVAWYALDKYWKAPLRTALVYALTSAPTKTKAE